MNNLYCPKCEYEIREESPIEGEEVFCQNCLAWSVIYISSENGELYLEFSKYDTRESK